MIDNKTQQAVIHTNYIYVCTQNNLIGPACLIVLISYMAENHDGFIQLAVGKSQKAKSRQWTNIRHESEDGCQTDPDLHPTRKPKTNHFTTLVPSMASWTKLQEDKHSPM